MQILFRMGVVAFLARRNIDHSLEILDTEADDGHGMGFHHGQVNDEIGV